MALVEVYEHFYFPTVGENIRMHSTAISQLVTGRNRRQKERCIF